MFVTGSCPGFAKRRRFNPISFSREMPELVLDHSKQELLCSNNSINTSSSARNTHSKTCTGTDLTLKTTPFLTFFLHQVFHPHCERILPLSVGSQRNLQPGSSTGSSLLLPLRDFHPLLISDTLEGLNEQKASE